MTELLDAKFAHLPTPLPKTNPTHPLKSGLRRSMLRLIGLRQSRQPDWPRRAKILLIRPDHLGDLLFLTPTLRYLRALLPQAHISLLAGSWGKAVLETNPHLDELLSCDFPGFTRRPKESLSQPYRYLYRQARLLRQHQFDLAIILRFDHWWGAWLAAAAGIPRRFGYDIPEVAPFLTDALPYRDQRHEVEQNWRLAHHAWSMGTLSIIDSWSDREVIGELEFYVPQSDRDWADTWLQAHHISDMGPLVVIHPGAGAAVKRWRPQAWSKLAQILIDRHRCQIVFSGGPAEVELCCRIAAQINPSPPVAAGKTTLAQLAALMSQATLAIGPDTGPLKLAAAVGTPTVELYGPVDVQKFGPWGDPTRQRYVTSGLSCLSCNYLDYRADELAAHFCIRGLAVQWVLREVVDLLEEVG